MGATSDEARLSRRIRPVDAGHELFLGPGQRLLFAHRTRPRSLSASSRREHHPAIIFLSDCSLSGRRRAPSGLLGRRRCTGAAAFNDLCCAHSRPPHIRLRICARGSRCGGTWNRTERILGLAKMGSSTVRIRTFTSSFSSTFPSGSLDRRTARVWFSSFPVAVATCWSFYTCGACAHFSRRPGLLLPPRPRASASAVSNSFLFMLGRLRSPFLFLAVSLRECGKPSRRPPC